MKILLVTGSLNQGGAEYQLLSLALLLQTRGHNIEVLALTDYNYFLPFILEKKIKYSCVSNEGSNFNRLTRAIEQINNKNPDLVISYIKKVSQVAILARVSSGFKYKLITSERTSLIKPWHDLFYFNLSLLANKLTVNSISKYEYLKKRFPLLKKRTIFIPNIIDIKKFAALKRSESKDGDIRISYVGRISPEKNIVNLIKAIRLVLNKGFNVSLSLYGEANNKNYLNEINHQIEELMLANNVIFHGPTKDVIQAYEKTDLLCLVSVFEGFSNVLSEALSCGIPVIASNIAENRYLIDDTINGFLVEPSDSQSIANGIERFVDLNQFEIKNISDNNKKKAMEIFDEDHIYTVYKKLFNNL